MQSFKELFALLLGLLACVMFIMLVAKVLRTAQAHSLQVPDRPACFSYISGEPRPISYCDFKNYKSK